MIESAPPLKIVWLMYEGALRFLRKAEETVSGSPRVYRDALQRADAIVAELRCTLDHEAGGEIAAQLEQLYLFVEQQISEALLQTDTQPIADARAVLERLLDGWKRIELVPEQAA
jgi:flagellar protein FliS